MLASLNPEQAAAVRLLLGQEKIVRERLEQMIQALQQQRLSAAEQDAADREAQERELAARRAQFVANRDAAERDRQVELRQPLAQVQAPPQPAIEGVLHAIAQRLEAVEVALSRNGGHMPQAVTGTAPSFVNAAPGFAIPGPGAAPLYNPGVNGPAYPWRR